MASYLDKGCPVCARRASFERGSGRFGVVTCDACGLWNMSDEFFLGIAPSLSVEDRWRLSWALRAASERGKPLFISTENYRQVIADEPERVDPLEPLDLAVSVIGKARKLGDAVALGENDFPLLRAKGPDEVGFIKNLLFKELAWATPDGGSARLTAKGWGRFNELRKVAADPSQAFVAMSFSEEHRFIWTEGLQPALEGCGYKPLNVGEEHFSKTIDDFIIASIRKSGLLVADFTGNKANVYFEAGFAMGLGIEVVRTCKAGPDFDEIRFDQEHYPILRWDTTEELKKRLTDRVNALGPLGKRPASGESR